MKRNLVLVLALAVSAVMANSCAVSDVQDAAGRPADAGPPPSPARMGLPAEYRVFYDELGDSGDWTLIEPYGWVFRPRVNFVAWRPYQEGWWEASPDLGWTWNSDEPFGWITYHYGNWMFDRYQGWVWVPGPAWGPAWVAWISLGDYVGWAPLPPQGYNDFASVPGGAFTFVGARDLAARSTGGSALYVSKLPAVDGTPYEIVNVGHAGGVAFNRGPDAALLQRLGAAAPVTGETTTIPRVRISGAPRLPTESELTARSHVLTAEAAREVTQFRDKGIAPPPVPSGGVPPVWQNAPGAGPVRPGAKPGARDTTRTAKKKASQHKKGSGAKGAATPGAAPDSTKR